jgi:hypothetical protein
MLVVSEAPIAERHAAAGALFARYPAARAIIMLPTFSDATPLEVAEDVFLPGRDAGPALRGLGFEGVLWAHDPTIAAEPGDLLTYRGRRLIARDALSGGVSLWTLNVGLGASTLTRTTTWPLIIDDIVEETRRALPGPRHFNIAVGESLSLSDAGIPPVPWIVSAVGGASRRFDRLPPLLSELAPGVYRITPAPEAIGADPEADPATPLPGWTVAANLFAPDESDLRDRGRTDAPIAEAWRAGEAEESHRPVSFYVLLTLLTALLVAWWALTRGPHDIARRTTTAPLSLSAAGGSPHGGAR